MSATGISLDVTRELRAICGSDFVTDGAELPSASKGEEGQPVIVKPGSADEVVAILRLANANGLRVLSIGGGTNLPTAAVRECDVVLSTSRLTEVEHYDPADLTVGVGAGTTVAQLSTMVGADRLLLAADPALPERANIGGVLAVASQGPLRHGYGGLRDFCIGIRFVTGDGRKAKGGGRVVKNVAGYDLMKLLIGSYGTLAVITSASFKLFPAPRQTRTFLAEFAAADEALQFRDLIVRSPLAPMCLELVSPGARKLMRPQMTSDAWVICVRAAGSDAVLARYRKELGSAVTREVEGADETGMWRAIENFAHAREGEGVQSSRSVASQIDVMTPPREVATAISAITEAASNLGIELGMVGRVGVGHLQVVTSPDAAHSQTMRLVQALHEGLGSEANVTVSSGMNPWPIAPPYLDSMRAVKQALDAKNVLRGRALF